MKASWAFLQVIFFVFCAKLVSALDAVTPLGCYTDTSVSRTLSAASYVDAIALTVESCRQFCSDGDYPYFGLEYAKECYCDYVLHSPGAPASNADCNMPCTGNSDEICGGPNRLNLYRVGNPVPPAVKQPVGSWAYQGCFQDIPVLRVLERRIPMPGSASAEKCTAACKSFGYLYAGLEYGDECYCGYHIGNAPQKPESECNMRCTGDHSEICGGPARLTLYKDTHPAPFDPQTCITLDNPMFNLQAWPKVPPPPEAGDFPPFYGIKPIIVDPIGYSILSWCEGCPAGSQWTYNSIVRGRMIPANVGFFATQSINLNRGESPSFISLPVDTPWPAYNGYCAMVDPELGPDSPPNFFAGGGRSDLWSLCLNVTANFRLDIVYAPRANHPHYSLPSCEPVWLKMV